MRELQATTDHELFLLIADGDELAFAELFYRYVAHLEPYFLNLLHSKTQTQEVIQQCFMRIWLSRDKLPAVENPRGWIFRIAANESHALFRKKITEEKFQKQLAHEEPLEIPTPGASRELREAIQEAIGKLSPQRRNIFLLSREEGLKISEIASQLNLAESTVKNTLSAALDSIRQHLVSKGLYEKGFIVLLLLGKNFFPWD